jgi:hypothetical protein
MILAIGLGIAGAIFNFAYLANRSRDVEKVAFVGVKEDKTVGRGERLTEDVLEPVEIPRRWVGNLANYAIKWDVRATVTGRPVWRPLDAGSLLLQSDLKTPPSELRFGQNLPPGTEEIEKGVPIDTRTQVPSLLEPGDMVSFIVTTVRPGFPTLAEPGKMSAIGRPDPLKAGGAADAVKAGGPSTPRVQAGDGIEMIGPFRVLSIGNRLGNSDVMRAAKIQQSQENVLTVAIRVENGKLDPQAQRLILALQQSNNRALDYVLHARTQRQNP